MGGAYSMVLKPASVRSHFQRSSSLNRLANQSQILYGASIGSGKQCVYKQSRSHDKDGHHAHIW